MKKHRGKKNKFVLDVTQKDYELEVAAGMSPKDAMKPGKHGFRRVDPRRVAKFEDLEPRNIKLVITVRIDSDIVEFFKKRAEKAGAPGYQTQMNDALRAFMERVDKDMPAGAVTLLENETFIEALAAKLQKKARRPKVSA